MKNKVTLQLSAEILARLAGAAEARCVNRAIVVERALEQFLAQPLDGPMPAQDRLQGLEQQLQTIRRDIEVLNETVALHARYHLAVTSLADQESAGEVSGDDRNFDQAGRISAIQRLQRDLSERRRETRPDGVARTGQVSQPISAQRRHAEPSIAEVSWGVPAAGEGGEDPFRLPPHATR
ncbi:protein of unknown function [Bradyrhizobium sp. ORS 285]|uniref:ribbon-helix-helix domain-containing protein n=1 Tax=Bradyrhizobium sp. ORS 285 TaxID=115808 RepID=UPI0002409FB6|nr:CopG family transcriptional regulator [Bradyrhizobium sp. ORS 285]CCD84677.1 hypothetical protein BRAO285_1230010 [Bradyrhizobium sp. ORS 285]SMX61220.1 protein of unknown function [Bradyrhizobium sp. ORS 285]